MRPVALAALLLVGCDDGKPKPGSGVEIVMPPVGQFQILPAGKTGDDFVVLNTATGSLRHCWLSVTPEPNMACGDASAMLDSPQAKIP